MDVRHGTEIAFRLGPGMHAEARVWAERLAQSAEGALRHVLFLNEEGEYGCLAEWDSADDARDYGDRAEVRAALDELTARVGKAPRVRVYAMEEQELGRP